ncbi:MAG: TIGR03016 family PEP-CTERM system-associated outer membrane protein, partial [Duganella sp.]
MVTTIKKSLHLALLLSPALAQAASWGIVPSVRVRQSYSDNVNLSPAAQKQGAWASEITPAVAVNLDGGQRLQLALSYALHQVYSEQRADRRDHQLDASGHAQLLPGWLYLDASAGIGRQNISAFGPRLSDSAQAPLNSATVRTYSISPYVQHVFPGLASVTLRYDARRVDSDRLLQVTSNGASLRMAGDNGNRGWNWDVFLERQHLDDSVMAPVTTSNARLMLSYPLGSSIGTFITAGYERRDYQSLSNAQGPEGRHSALGANWTPSPRTRVSASIGRRYFGKTYAFDAAYRMRNMLWNASYHEDITTMHAQFFSVPPTGLGDFLYQLWETRIPDPQKRRQSIQLFLLMSQMLGTDGNVNVFSHRYYLQKSLRLASVYSGARGALA